MNSNTSRSVWWIGGVGLLVVQSACFASRERALGEVAAPARIQLESTTGFRLRSEAAVADGGCRARKLSGRVVRRQGDTLVLRDVRYRTPPEGGPACAWVGNTVVEPVESASVTAREVRFSLGRTLYLLAVAVPVFIATAAMLSVEIVD